MTRSFLLSLAFGLLLPAARGADAPPAAPLGDPFVKKNTASPVLPNEPPANVIFTMESYNLDLDDAAKVLQENDDGQARFDHVLALQKAGKARLTALLSGGCTSGENSKVEMITIMRFPIAFDVADKPTDYKERQLGYRLVYKAQTTADGKSLDTSLFFEHNRFAGFDQIAYGKGAVPQPQFHDARVNTKTLLRFGQFQLLGTPNSNPNAGPADPTQTTLSFGKADLVPIDPGRPTARQPLTLMNQLSIYSMPPEDAEAILNARQTANSAYEAVQGLVKTGDARLERIAVLTTRPDVKTNSDEVMEVTYPTVPGQPEFVTQDVGLMIDLEPDSIANSPLFFLKTLSTRWIRELGYLRGDTIVAGRSDLPIFGSSAIDTRLKAALGNHELMGTFTPPSESGLLQEPKPDHRIWLEFVCVTPSSK